MERELRKIIIIPGRFIKETEKGFIVRCLIDDDITEDREFDKYSLMGMKNVKYLFMGIMTGVGYIQANFVQADEYEKMFKRKWKILTK